jgi:hypothetical protein
MDLGVDYEADSLADCLRSHPCVEIVVCDRGEAHAEGHALALPTHSTSPIASV